MRTGGRTTLGVRPPELADGAGPGKGQRTLRIGRMASAPTSERAPPTRKSGV